MTQTDNDALVRYLSDHFDWAAPGDQQEDVWLLRFCDNDVRDLIWTGADAEREAWEAWNRHAPGYNCYLFRLAALRSPAPVVDGPLAGKVERPYAFCCAEGGGDPKFCDCVNKNHGTAWFDAPKATRPQPAQDEESDALVDLIREWLLSTDHPVSQGGREFAAAITGLRQHSGESALREALIDETASLAAACSLLERAGKVAKKGAPSDLMFNQMLRDYQASLARARAALGGGA